MGDVVSMFQAGPSATTTQTIYTGAGGGDGMDPWQSSVENRLSSLDARAGRMEPDIASIKIDVAVLTERVAHLPTKGFIVTATISALVVIAALSAFVQWILAAKL